MSHLDIFLRLAIAAVLGAIIGFEREYFGKAAGFRAAAARGVLTRREIFEEYRSFLRKHSHLASRRLSLVVDSANGITGVREFLILQELFPDIVGMYLEPDGDFPNHEPNPLVLENIRPLQEKVLELKADAGIAFDGDGDRVAFVDNLGNAVSGDLITALIAGAELREHPGATVLYDLRSSRAVKEEIERLFKVKVGAINTSLVVVQPDGSVRPVIATVPGTIDNPRWLARR